MHISDYIRVSWGKCNGRVGEKLHVPWHRTGMVASFGASCPTHVLVAILKPPSNTWRTGASRPLTRPNAWRQQTLFAVYLRRVSLGRNSLLGEVRVSGPANSLRQRRRSRCVDRVPPARHPADEPLADTASDVRRGERQQEVGGSSLRRLRTVLVSDGDDHRRLNGGQDRSIRARNLGETCADGSGGSSSSVNDSVDFLARC